MQIPKRRSENNQPETDYHLSQAKFDQLKKELERLVKIVRPRLSDEVAELAKLGDFSENAAYQIAKGKLRGTNHRILVIEDLLNNAIIIPACAPGACVQMGSQVTVETGGQTKIFQILGPQETNPSQGIISQLSPIGSALLGHRVNDEVEAEINDKIAKYKIIRIE